MSTALAFAIAVAASGCADASSALPFGADAASCATCHETQYEAWRGSAHASSGSSPVFVALLDETRATWGEAAADACVSCHQPGHAGHAADAAITCVSCHAATGSIGERDGRLVVDPRYPLMGPSGNGSNGAHEIRSGEFLSSASLCGTCHQVSAPGLLDEPTLSEYRQSRFAEAGISCADCHMPDGEHRFIGVNPAWGADESARSAARGGAHRLLADALTLTLARDRDESGGEALVVTLENDGAGHAVPTGAAFLRELWVDVTFAGAPSPEDLRVLSLGAELTRDGQPVPLITDADEVRPRGLAPGERRSELVRVPPGATDATATLRFRAVRWDTLEALGLGARIGEVPTLEVQSVTVGLGGVD